MQRSQYCAPVFSIQEQRIEQLLQEAEKISAAANGVASAVRPWLPTCCSCTRVWSKLGQACISSSCGLVLYGTHEA